MKKKSKKRNRPRFGRLDGTFRPDEELDDQRMASLGEDDDLYYGRPGRFDYEGWKGDLDARASRRAGLRIRDIYWGIL